MGTSVNTILHNSLGDGGRFTKYRVIAIIPDAVLKLGPTKSTSDIDVLAKSLNIPEVINEPIEIKIKGHGVPIINKSNYNQSFSITFYVDEKHQIRDTFLKWIKALDGTLQTTEKDKTFFSIGEMDLGSPNPFGNLLPTTSSGAGLKTELKVQVMDFEEEIVNGEFLFSDVFPISVEGVNFDSTQVSGIQEMTVNFKYSSYLYTPGKGLLDGIGAIIDAGLDFIENKITDLTGGSTIGDMLGFGDSSEGNIADKFSGSSPQDSSNSDIFERKGIING